MISAIERCSDTLPRTAQRSAASVLARPVAMNGAAAVLYLRVSTQRQMLTAIDIDPDGNSIAIQRESTIKRAKRLQAPISKEFVEPGHSAQSIAKRPIFRELLHYVEDNPEVDYVIIYMRSRVFRNQTDAAITRRILDSMGVRLISAKEEFGEGYMADAMEAITDIMNEVQVRQSGEDISNKMYHKAKNGGTVGRARIGYLNVREDVDGHLVNSIGIDPDRAPWITWAFEQYATGDFSLTRLQHELGVQGLTTRRTAKWEEKPLSRSQLGYLLRDPYYLGMMPYKGEIFPGKHRALVTPEVFERVQQVIDMRKRRNQRDVVHNHFLRAMLRCARCGNRQLVFSRVRNVRGTEYEYFLCLGRQEGSCDLPHLPVAFVEDAMLQEVQKLQLTTDEIDTMRSQVESQLEKQLRSQRETQGRVKKELSALDIKEERLLDFAADGAMKTDKLRDRMAQLQVQRNALTSRLEATETVIRQESDTILRYLDLLEKPGAFYAAASDAVKRKLLTAFYSQIWIDDDGHQVLPQPEPREVVKQISDSARRSSSESKVTEQKLGDSGMEASASYSFGLCLNNETLVGTVDSNVNNQVNSRHLLPPTPIEIEKLVKKLRKMKLPPVQDEATQADYHSLRRRLTPEDIQTIAKRYKARESISSISREYGISRPSLRSLLREAGLSPHRQGMTTEDEDRAVQLYESGLTIYEVIDRVGYSYGVVCRMLHKRGVKVRPRRHQG